jgi:hypothetical protein
MLNLRLPNLRYDRIYWVLFLVIITVILIGAIARKRKSYPTSTEVNVVALANGEKLISEGDVRQALLRAFGNDLENTEIAELDVERMERVMEEDPFVEDAEIYVDQNNILHVELLVPFNVSLLDSTAVPFKLGKKAFTVNVKLKKNQTIFLPGVGVNQLGDLDVYENKKAGISVKVIFVPVN